MRILIMGLPGSGKTTLAQEILKHLHDTDKTVTWLNADIIRETYNDWDFSFDGRLRQAQRMKSLATLSTSDYCICDFVAPLQEMRTIFAADYTIWVDTILTCRFEDTNSLFEPPTKYDLRIQNQNAKKWAKEIAHLLTKLD